MTASGTAGLQQMPPVGFLPSLGNGTILQKGPAQGPGGSPDPLSAATPAATSTKMPMPAATATSGPAPAASTSTPAPAPVASATPTAVPTLAAKPTLPDATAAPSASPSPSPTVSPVPAPDVIFVGAGDIADCRSPGAAATARLLDGIAGTVFTLGDNAYPSGAAAEFANCYSPTWGRHKARTTPAAGNHEYLTLGASPYFSYFGAAAGDPGKGYYSFNLGSWHIVVLNSNCSNVGGCGPATPQVKWLVADLAANPALCTMALEHVPRFSSGRHGSAPEIQPIWQALYDAGAELILAGHDHDYERFAPQDPSGRADPARGLRQIVAGTGGASHYTLGPRVANSEVSNGDTYGVLKLTLRANGYDWQFVPEPGKTFTDSGRASCH